MDGFVEFPVDTAAQEIVVGRNTRPGFHIAEAVLGNLFGQLRPNWLEIVIGLLLVIEALPVSGGWLG